MHPSATTTTGKESSDVDILHDRLDSVLAAIQSLGKTVNSNQHEQESINRKLLEWCSNSLDSNAKDSHKSGTGNRKKPPEDPGSCWRTNRMNMEGEKTEAHPRFRLDSPRFDGSNVEDWIFKLHNYFDFYPATESEKLRAVINLFDPPSIQMDAILLCEQQPCILGGLLGCSTTTL